MHLIAFFLQALRLLLVIIFEPTTAAAVPTARPIPMPFITDMVFEDESIIKSPPINILVDILT